jgi:integrase
MGKFSASVKPYNSAARPKAKWVVNIWHPSGRRQRKFCSTREKADRAAEVAESKFESHGKRGLELDDSLSAAALEAKEKLAPLGVTLSEVVKDYVRRRNCVSMSVTECAELYLNSLEEKKKKRSKKHLTALRCVYARFGRAFSSHRVSDITPADIKEWLCGVGGSAGTFNSYRTLLHALFELGIEKGACVENPVKKVRREESDDGEVGILSPVQLKRVLEKSAGDVRATVAIGAFAGVRPEEISRLTWEEIDWSRGVIAINAFKSKTGRHRYVKMLPCLKAWLRPLIRSGSIQGDNFRRRYEECRRKAGFALRGNRERRKGDQDKGLDPWPHDGLRHSFASYHLAKFRDAAGLALEMGHESTKLIFRHYRRRVSSEEAEAYFKIKPAGHKAEGRGRMLRRRRSAGTLPPRLYTSTHN